MVTTLCPASLQPVHALRGTAAGPDRSLQTEPAGKASDHATGLASTNISNKAFTTTTALTAHIDHHSVVTILAATGTEALHRFV
jgi:hypothetical protein